MLENLVEPFIFLNQFNNLSSIDSKSLVSTRSLYSSFSIKNNVNSENPLVEKIETYLKSNLFSKIDFYL